MTASALCRSISHKVYIFVGCQYFDLIFKFWKRLYIFHGVFYRFHYSWGYGGETLRSIICRFIALSLKYRIISKVVCYKWNKSPIISGGIPILTKNFTFIITKFYSSNVRSWKFLYTNWKALQWILKSFCSINILWSIQIRGQYGSCDVIKLFLRVLRFLASRKIKILAKSCFFAKLVDMVIKI